MNSSVVEKKRRETNPKTHRRTMLRLRGVLGSNADTTVTKTQL